MHSLRDLSTRSRDLKVLFVNPMVDKWLQWNTARDDDTKLSAMSANLESKAGRIPVFHHALGEIVAVTFAKRDSSKEDDLQGFLSVLHFFRLFRRQRRFVLQYFSCIVVGPRG